MFLVQFESEFVLNTNSADRLDSLASTPSFHMPRRFHMVLSTDMSARIKVVVSESGMSTAGNISPGVHSIQALLAEVGAC